MVDQWMKSSAISADNTRALSTLQTKRSRVLQVRLHHPPGTNIFSSTALQAERERHTHTDMKEKIGKNVSNPALNLRAGLIRKKRPEEEMLSRLREYLQYSKLKHLLQAYPFQSQVGQTRKSQVCEEKAMEVDVEAWEIPEDCSDEEISTTLQDSDASVLERRDNKYNKESRELACEVEVEEDDEESQEEFVPSIKIRRIDDLLLISTVVLKEVALSSSLFAILEEEDKLHILSENQYRTETKAAHTIQVKIQPDFKVDELERKLRFWATNTR